MSDRRIEDDAERIRRYGRNSKSGECQLFEGENRRGANQLPIEQTQRPGLLLRHHHQKKEVIDATC